MRTIIAAPLAIGLAVVPALCATAQIGYTGGSYSQNFDTLISSGTAAWTNNPASDTTDGLHGWFAARQNTGTLNLLGSTGSSNTGSLYSFGAAGSGERALGSVGSGTPGTLFYGLQITNTSSVAFDSVTISYTGEQWRNGGSQASGSLPTRNQLDFAYGIDTGSISGNGYTDYNALDFAALKYPTTLGVTASALDGNLSENRTSLTQTIQLSTPWAAGQSLWLRWIDVDDPSNDQGLGIDDFSFSATAASTAVPAPPALVSGLIGLAMGGLQFVRVRRRRGATVEQA